MKTHTVSCLLSRLRLSQAVAVVLVGAFTLYSLVVPPLAQGVSSTVVISEFRTRGPNGGNDEFIELYNLSAAPVNIGGWKIKGSNNSGTVSTRAVINSGVTLGPGCHYLLTNPTTSGGPYSGSVVGNQTFAPGITDDGGIAVTLPDDTIVDQIGLSGGSAFKEGSTLTPLTTSANRSYERKPGGAAGSGTDTDNNSADFQLKDPSDPQSQSGACIAGSTPSDPTGTGAANPATVAPGGSVLLTVLVAPGTNPTSTGITVTGNLSPIGGSPAQQFFDNGTNGDVTAGDNTFSFQAAVPGSTSEGAKTVSVTIADAQARIGSASITFTVESSPAGGIRIHTIQGAAHTSPRSGTSVSNVPGIVTAKRSNGFYMQDPLPDGSEATSEAIFVFTSSAPAVNVGDSVLVSGTVGEFRPGNDTTNLTITQITSPTVAVQSSGNPLPAATIIGTGGRTPPAMIIDDDAAGNVETGGTFDPVSDGIDFYESLEGMLVQVNNPVVVGPRTSSGEIVVLADNGASASVRTGRGGIVVRSTDFNPERIVIDNAIAATPQVSVGDRFAAAIVGVVDYSFGNFKLQTTQPLAAVSGGLSQEVTTPAAEGQIAVATFNVENLDPNDPPSKFSTLANLIVNNLKAPDIIALEEVQDNNGATNDSEVDATATYTTLINAIVAAGGPAYQFRNINPVDDQDGGEPGGNIRVGFLFRTDRGVSFIDRSGGSATAPTTVVSGGFGPELSFSPGRIDPTNPAFASSRKPLAGEFVFGGQKLFVIANHFTSKGGDQPLFGRFQPPTLSSETKRIQQAQVVNDFVDAILAVSPSANVVVLGDFNDFEFSSAITTLKGSVLSDLIETLPESERYTYVFEGNSQSLDHILVSSNLFNNSAFAYDVVHVNSEFVVQSSDHDPQVVRLSLASAAPDFALSFAAPTLTVQRNSTVSTTVTITRTGGFMGDVRVSAQNASALKVKLKPKSRTTSGTSTNFRLKIKGNAPTGQQQLMFTGRDTTGRERTATLTLIVQ
jgi:predicted extracellular nuclease